MFYVPSSPPLACVLFILLIFSLDLHIFLDSTKNIATEEVRITQKFKIDAFDLCQISIENTKSPSMFLGDGVHNFCGP